jgi:hypothetical protein
LAQDFPYNFEEGIEHHVLWCSEPMSEAEVQEHVVQRFPGKAICHWVNPVQLQSVLAVSCNKINKGRHGATPPCCAQLVPATALCVMLTACCMPLHSGCSVAGVAC